jgi:L-cysteine:1D-myo-inositol 2-amino-2-deoxy-alpha-D-glucopyranoside ligase
VPFQPLGVGPIGLYVCGITPYDTTHLGHAFTYLVFDVLQRYLAYLGHEVTYVQNLTDVDDDILRRARELNEDYLELGRYHADRFLSDMAALNWRAPDVLPRATEHIPQMQAMIERLLSNGHAYRSDAFVYLNAATDPGWGSLSHVPAAEQLALAAERGNRADLPGKRDPIDPVLWQPSASDEPAWDAPWGPGRPGWHIECSAMSVTHLGPRFEIHGGGVDLAFPHHESERLQSEAATGQHPVVGHWVHTGMVHSDDAKMSKSLGNLVMVRDLLSDWSADTIRMALLRHRYREDLLWTDDRLTDAQATVDRWGAVVGADGVSEWTDPAALPPEVEALRTSALEALDDDLDTVRMIAALDELAALHSSPALAVLADLARSVLGLRLDAVT